MRVYPFFKIQNYRQNKISGFVPVICFMERHKYCSFTITKKRSVALEKGHWTYGFLKLKDFYRIVNLSWKETENELTWRMTPSLTSRTHASCAQYLMAEYQKDSSSQTGHIITIIPWMQPTWSQNIFWAVTPERIGKD